MPEQNREFYPAHETLSRAVEQFNNGEKGSSISAASGMLVAEFDELQELYHSLLAKQEEDAGLIRELFTEVVASRLIFKEMITNPTSVPTGALDIQVRAADLAISKAQIRLREV